MKNTTQESRTLPYLTSQIFTLLATPVELSSEKASHFSWELLETGETF